jgi:hypothetical protein
MVFNVSLGDIAVLLATEKGVTRENQHEQYTRFDQVTIIQCIYS